MKHSRFPPELQASILLALVHLHFVCGICNEIIIDCVCLPCGHNFCIHCLYQWFRFNRICPICFTHVKDNFKLQRIYCVDEFLAELYQPVQELSATLFGTVTSPDLPSAFELERSVSEIQASIQNTRIVTATTPEQRLRLKKLRRDYASNYPEHYTRAEYSLLEQQTELFGGVHSLNLASVVQFFLSLVTAYITYEGGDTVDNDYILLAVVSLLIWFIIFMAVMRYMGHEGSFTELLMRLNFIELSYQDDAQTGVEDITDEDYQSEEEFTTDFSSSDSFLQIHNNNDYDSDLMTSEIRRHRPVTPNNEIVLVDEFHTPCSTEWETDEDHELEFQESNLSFSSSEASSSTS